MNNKKLGTAFEKKMCELLSKQGYWVHFISPDARGSQPFDIIAVRDDIAVAIDCKTCEDHIFRIGRLEDNQINAFDLWERRGNSLAYIAILHEDKIYMMHYCDLKKYGKRLLEETSVWAEGIVLEGK